MMDRLETGFSHANRFSADVSHELKTPITVMQAEIETALQESVADSPEETRLLVLREEVGRLKSITQSLMLLSQADVGELIRKSDPISLSEELQSLVEDAEIVAEGAGISVAASLSPDVEVRGDPVLLRQALLNLINNAIKYNVPEGDVSVILAAQSDHAMISIENSSEGISPADQEKIFDRFYRADQSRSRGVDGFGLGLSLAQAVVKGHGGTIDLIVEEEKRTRFEVRFPLSREGS
jgi:signal transduction histidine kinase